MSGNYSDNNLTAVLKKFKTLLTELTEQNKEDMNLGIDDYLYLNGIRIDGYSKARLEDKYLYKENNAISKIIESLDSFLMLQQSNPPRDIKPETYRDMKEFIDNLDDQCINLMTIKKQFQLFSEAASAISPTIKNELNSAEKQRQEQVKQKQYVLERQKENMRLEQMRIEKQNKECRIQKFKTDVSRLKRYISRQEQKTDAHKSHWFGFFSRDHLLQAARTLEKTISDNGKLNIDNVSKEDINILMRNHPALRISSVFNADEKELNFICKEISLNFQ